MQILKICRIKYFCIFLFFFILLSNSTHSFSEITVSGNSSDVVVEVVVEIVAGTVTDRTASTAIKPISPEIVRYGKQTDINLVVENAIIKKNGPATRALLSPGGPFIAKSLKTILPPVSVISDSLVINGRIFVATENGYIFSLQNEKQAKLKKIHLPSPILRLTYFQSTLFALTQAGFLVSVKLPDFKVENKIKIEGNVTDIAANDKYLYLLQHHNKLLIYDAHPPTQLRQVAQHRLKLPALAIFVNKNYCYLATGKNGLATLDITNINAIHELGSFKTSGIVKNIVVKDNFAYIADGPIGLTVLDISEPEKITLLGSNNKLGTLAHIAIHQSAAQPPRILVANTDNKLTLLDISRPEAPSVLSSHQSTDIIKKISFVEHTAIVTLSNDIQMVDFSAEITPAINSEGVTLGGSRRAVIKNNIMYVADWFSGLHIYDVSDPLNMKHLGNYHTKGSSKGVAIKDGHAFVGDDDHGLQIINIKDPANPFWVSELATTGLAYTMKILGNILYLADHRGGFHIIDITNFKQPKRLGTIDTPGKAWAIDVDGNTAFVADDLSGLLIFDVSSHHNPKLIAQFKPGGFAEDVKIRNGQAFVTFFDSGLYILDIKSPANPKLLSHIPIPGNARGIELENNIAYISAWYAGIQIVDIENIRSPKIIGYYDTDGATWGTAKTDTHLYALDWWGGIKSIDVKDNHNPILISRYHAKNITNDLEIRENYAYTTNGKSGLQVFDVRNSLNPMWVTALELPGEVDSISIYDRYAYLTSKNKIYVVEIETPFKQKLVNTIEIADGIAAFNLHNNFHNNFAFVLNKKGNLITYNIAIADQPKIIATTKISATNFWVNDNYLVATNDVAVNEKHELLIYTINNDGHIILINKYIAKTNIDSINFFNGNLFVYTKDANRLFTLSKTNNGYEETASTQLNEIIIDIKISNGVLYATSKQSRLITFTINDDKQLLFRNVYPAANKVKRFRVDKERVFFAGDNLLSTLIPLPEITSNHSSSTKISISIPKKIPLGIYDLLLLKNEKTILELNNSISVELPNFQKPQFSK